MARWYQSDTIAGVAMTLRLTDDEQASLRQRAEREGISMQAAALLQSILKCHALVDGNKRLGWLGTATFLEINGIGVTHVPNHAVYDFVITVAAGHADVGEIAVGLRRLATG